MSNARQDTRPGLDLARVPHPNESPPPGRPPPKYTREIHEKIVEGIRSGFTPENMAAACGISRSMFRDWLRKGADGDPYLVDFHEDVEAAMAMALLRNEAGIFDGVTPKGACAKCGRSEDAPSLKDRLAIAEMRLKIAERRDAKNWNKEQKIVVRNELEGFLADCERLLPPNRYNEILQIAAGRAGATAFTEDSEGDE